MISYVKLEKSLTLLQEQNNRLLSVTDDQEEWIVEAVKESIIQRFEICWDTLWKTLRRYLREEIGVPEVTNRPNPILHLAHENAILSPSIEQWLHYAQLRVQTSHDYNEEKAEEALTYVTSFIHHAAILYKTMSGKSLL